MSAAPKPHTTTAYRYAPVPEALLYDPAISDKAVRVYATLARHGMDPSSCYPSHARIAELIGAAPRSIQRPLRDLEAAGWIVRVRRIAEDGGRTTDGFHVHTENAHDRAPTALLSVEPTAQLDRAPARAEREPENDSQPERENTGARELVQQVWEGSDTTPATPFIAALKIAEKLLGAGHRPEAIKAAMLAVPTISMGWVEAELRRGSRAPKRATVGPVDSDREAPAGRLDL